MMISTDDQFIHAFDHGHEFTEGELEKFCLGYYGKLIEVSIEEKKRWVNFTRTICRICGRYFALDWQEWLADHQDNQYPDQPYEVAKHEYEKTIKVVEWNKI